MIVVRKVEERPRQSASRRLSLRGPPRAGVALALYDLRLPPGKRIELDDRLRVELITYVVAGTLRHAVGKHASALLVPGEFQRVALGLTQDAAHTQTNTSRSETSHVVQMLVHDARLSLVPDHEQRRFWLAERRGLLRKVAAPAADLRQLPLQSQLALYSSLLDPGQHLVHALAAAHSGVLHVISGQLDVADEVLGPGATAYVQDERSLAFTAREPAEILLGDICDLTSF